jgi:hypothetical protein
MKTSLAIWLMTLALLVAGCGAGSSDDTTAAAASANTDPAGRGGPSGSGEVVDVADSTAQVQNQQGQVAVSWTDDTTFTQQVDADLSAVTVGSCVMVTTGDSADASETDVAAATVRITESTDDGCAAGAGPGGGGAGDRPEGGTPPSGAPDGGARAMGTSGEVTAVSDSGFTVEATQPGSDTTSTVVVTVSSDTTYTTTAEASADDVTVGRCVTSRGEADDTGAITATTIAISDKVDDACSTGFGGMRPQDDA